eukprot:CAMPEP_0197238806 /NCGR_PEP_ID=MMETSP1429-20130617/5313_1 /TAXON_ID=49237 /ORGANISM="Chaetoceros  sp., Strain UNC1202" /LENGTH=257 /DNA_ID=CAMNT_0042698065 /DNA_START=40 /DNA_END=813 /DNA_ORIENTATION=+
MVAAAVSPSQPSLQCQSHSISTDPSSIGTVARKRRRQILQSQRLKTAETTTSISTITSPVPPAVAESESIPDPEPPLKKICTAEPPSVDSEDEQRTRTMSDASADKKTKRPQMRYEPDIPMTKDEAAVWRREQRRKRNRESAAASRQRQRDRISELEEEVDEWKDRFQAAMDRLSKLEALQGPTADQPDIVTSARDSVAVSPCPSPDLTPVSPQPTLSSDDLGLSCDGTEPIQMPLDTMPITDGNGQHLNEKISRPA